MLKDIVGQIIETGKYNPEIRTDYSNREVIIINKDGGQIAMGKDIYGDVIERKVPKILNDILDKVNSVDKEIVDKLDLISTGTDVALKLYKKYANKITKMGDSLVLHEKGKFNLVIDAKRLINFDKCQMFGETLLPLDNSTAAFIKSEIALDPYIKGNIIDIILKDDLYSKVVAEKKANPEWGPVVSYNVMHGDIVCASVIMRIM